METTTVASPELAASSMSPLTGLMILGAVVLVVVGFIMLTMAFGNKDPWVGFLFLTYWAGREEMKFEELPKCVGGALFGIFMAYLLQVLPPQMGATGLYVAVGVILIAVYCQVMGWFPVVANVVAMLFLTVGAVPYIQSNGNFANIAFALVLGILFFAGLVWILGLFQKKQAAAA